MLGFCQDSTGRSLSAWVPLKSGFATRGVLREARVLAVGGGHGRWRGGGHGRQASFLLVFYVALALEFSLGIYYFYNITTDITNVNNYPF